MFHRGFKHSKTIKALGLRPRAFISFLVFETPMKHSHSFLKYCVLHCIVLCVVLCRVVLYCIVCCVVLYCIVLYCISLMFFYLCKVLFSCFLQHLTVILSMLKITQNTVTEPPFKGVKDFSRCSMPLDPERLKPAAIMGTAMPGLTAFFS